MGEAPAVERGLAHGDAEFGNVLRVFETLIALKAKEVGVAIARLHWRAACADRIAAIHVLPVAARVSDDGQWLAEATC